MLGHQANPLLASPATGTVQVQPMEALPQMELLEGLVQSSSHGFPLASLAEPPHPSVEHLTALLVMPNRINAEEGIVALVHFAHESPEMPNSAQHIQMLMPIVKLLTSLPPNSF